MAIKTFSPELTILRQLVTPDEIDRYEVFSIRPAIGGAVYASAGTAGTAAVPAFVVKNTPDWPRNVSFALAGSATGMAGTMSLVGKDQFGNSITESFGFGSADNGGTVVGTKVFSQISSGTLLYGTAVGNGTPLIGPASGTNCLLGLPVKLNGTTDVVHLGMAVGTGEITYNGGTIAAFVDVPMSAVRPAAALDGTAIVNVWVKPTFPGENYSGGTFMRNMTALT